MTPYWWGVEGAGSTHLVGHVVHHYDAVGSSVVTGRDGAEPFLTGRVPLRRQSEAGHTCADQSVSELFRAQHRDRAFHSQSEAWWSSHPARWSWSWSPRRWCWCSSLCTCRPGRKTQTRTWVWGAKEGKWEHFDGCYATMGDTHCEPEEETRLSHTRITDQEQFE